MTPNSDAYSVNSPDLLRSNSIVTELETRGAKNHVWQRLSTRLPETCQAAETCPEKRGTFPELDFIKQCLSVFEWIFPSEKSHYSPS